MTPINRLVSLLGAESKITLALRTAILESLTEDSLRLGRLAAINPPSGQGLSGDRPAVSTRPSWQLIDK